MSKKKPVVNLFLDCGAFSAWNRGERLSIHGYIKYVQENIDYLYCYASMDKIPGMFGRKRTQAEVEASAAKSYENHKLMKKEGLKPIPIFHQGESYDWLKRYVDDGDAYIGISTAKDESTISQIAWLDDVFTMLCDEKGRPIVKTHGFGTTKPVLMMRYPFFTVDSTTWTLTPGYGSIVVPVWKRGAFCYDEPPMRVIFSDVVRTQAGGTSYDDLGAFQRLLVEQYLAECGLNVHETIYVPDNRRRVMLHYYLQFEKHHTIKPFFATRNFFGGAQRLQDKSKVKPWRTVTVMQATSMTHRGWGQMMTEMGANNRLLNYYDLREFPYEVMREFVMEGSRISGKRTKQRGANFQSEGYWNARKMALIKRVINNKGVVEDGTESID